MAALVRALSLLDFVKHRHGGKQGLFYPYTFDLPLTKTRIRISVHGQKGHDLQNALVKKANLDAKCPTCTALAALPNQEMLCWSGVAEAPHLVPRALPLLLQPIQQLLGR